MRNSSLPAYSRPCSSPRAEYPELRIAPLCLISIIPVLHHLFSEFSRSQLSSCFTSLRTLSGLNPRSPDYRWAVVRILDSLMQRSSLLDLRHACSPRKHHYRNDHSTFVESAFYKSSAPCRPGCLRATERRSNSLNAPSKNTNFPEN